MTTAARVRIAVLVAVGVALGSAWALGLFDLLADPREAAAVLREAGGWGYLLYLVSFSLLAPFFVPGIAFVVPAAMIWPRWLALGLSILGAGGAGTVGFAFARFLARDWVAARTPARLRAWDAALQARPVRTVVWIRLLTAFFPPAHWALGLSGVGYGSFVLGTMLGLTPLIVALTFLGGGLMDWALAQPPESWWWMAGGALAVGVAYRALSRRRDAGAATP